MLKVVIGDVHARWSKMRVLLEDIGALTLGADPYRDKRTDGFHLIQLGDVVSLGYGEREAAFLTWWFDVVKPDESLLGNHELPAVYHDPYRVMFHGYEHRHEFAERELKNWRFPVTEDHLPHLRSMLADGYEFEVGRDDIATHMVRDWYDQGKFEVATSVGDWLITHAGLASRYEKRFGWKGAPVEEIAGELNEIFRSCQEAKSCTSVIDDYSDHEGGIMWQRIEYLRNGYDNNSRQLKQIVGHTGYASDGNGPRTFGDNLWLIDTPKPSLGNYTTRAESFGGVAALVTEDEGETWKLYYEE